MVVFWQQNHQTCLDWPVQVFSTVPLIPNLTSLVQHDFNVGTFAQFGDPFLSIHFNHRTDFYNASHLRIRQQLDAENFVDPFMLVDGDTAQSHAIWDVTTTDDSYELSGCWSPPVTYPGENFTLWQSHVLIQDFPRQFQLVSSGDIGFEDTIPAGRYDPYDPHDPQIPPYTEGHDYATKEGAQNINSATINATFSEVMYTDDPSITHRMLNPPPQWAVALKPRPARMAGLVSPRPNTTYIYEWSFWFRDEPPQPGEVIQLNAQYDWDSPRWPRPGVVGPFPGPTASLALGAGISRGPRVSSSQQCIRRKLGSPGLVMPGRNAVRAGTRDGAAAA
ncbi:MAG: hypothetical protein Q9198_005150 [Flavoplaca austrocitrina]